MADRPARQPEPDLQGLEFDARRSQRLQTVDLLRAGRTSLQVIAIAQNAESVAQAALATLTSRQPPRRPAACAEGCAWCCRKSVGTAVPEVERIVHYLHTQTSPTERTTLQVRAGELLEQRRALKQDRWTTSRLPCVFLEKERCSIYPVRPLTCRGFTSSDARACERHLRERARVNIPVDEPQLRIATFVLDGLRAGLTEVGLTGDLLELTSAIKIALAEPDAFERWRNGEAVFAKARML